MKFNPFFYVSILLFLRLPKNKNEIMKKALLLILLLPIISCNTKEANRTLQQGIYRATLDVKDDEVLPFNFEVKADGTINLFNAEEIIEGNSVTYRNDSVFVNFPVFEGYIAATLEGNNLKGEYIKESLERVVPFYAEFDNKIRFESTTEPTINLSGVWETLFAEVDGSTFIAKGIFKQEGNKVTGTIRTTTGDYRFLEGVINGNDVKFSAFDGAHAFLFAATATDSSLQGVFYSGNHYKATFRAIRNPEYELPHEDTLTFLKEGYDALTFSFPDAKGTMVSLEDEQFKDKVVIVQLMGTWCPNCLEESQYYKTFIDANTDKEIAFVSLAFEYAKTQEKAFEGIKRLQNRLGLEYPILLAQYGTSDKQKAQEKLPMLNHVLSYPTTIFIDKQGKVRKTHTGFNGAATGDKFTSFKKEFTEFVEGLLGE